MLKQSATTQTKSERYRAVWEHMKANGFCELTVHKNQVSGVIWGVKRAKSRDTVARVAFGLPRHPKLTIETTQITPELIKLHFHLRHDPHIL